MLILAVKAVVLKPTNEPIHTDSSCDVIILPLHLGGDISDRYVHPINNAKLIPIPSNSLHINNRVKYDDDRIQVNNSDIIINTSAIARPILRPN